MMANDPREIDENGNPVDPDGGERDAGETSEQFATDGDLDTGELDLADEDESLPWLESSDYDDDDGGVGAGQIIGFMLLGLVALAALIGGIWWASNRGSDGAMVADGSTIAAPKGDYKEKPQNPGGKQFEGTGDSSFAVGEGKSREGVLGDKRVPMPSIDAATTSNTKPVKGPVPGAASTAAASKAAPAATAAPAGYVVQVAALATKEAAERGWNDIRGRTDALSGVKYNIVEGQSDIGKVYRVQVAAGSKAAADKICAGMKADGLPCTVKKN